jgi:CYTH domain-containing protein
MAIENERKFILLPKSDVGYMTDLELLGTTTVDKIFQAYLPGNARIRRIVNKYAYGYPDPDTQAWIEPESVMKFTYKLHTAGGLVEIETDLSQSDFDNLFPIAQRQIVKTRITVPEGDLNWEVDFFHDEYNNNLYLVMAEVELPEGVDAPDTIPAFITDHLLHVVDRDDRRFDNANLSDPASVRANVAYLVKQQEVTKQDLEYFRQNLNGTLNINVN